jgi:hypothetical protein
MGWLYGTLSGIGLVLVFIGLPVLLAVLDERRHASAEPCGKLDHHPPHYWEVPFHGKGVLLRCPGRDALTEVVHQVWLEIQNRPECQHWPRDVVKLMDGTEVAYICRKNPKHVVLNREWIEHG